MRVRVGIHFFDGWQAHKVPKVGNKKHGVYHSFGSNREWKHDIQVLSLRFVGACSPGVELLYRLRHLVDLTIVSSFLQSSLNGIRQQRKEPVGVGESPTLTEDLVFYPPSIVTWNTIRHPQNTPPAS